MQKDNLLAGQRRVLDFQAAPQRALSSVRNWVDGNGCIARDETAYLGTFDDLLSIASPSDHATSWIEALVEDGSIFLGRRFRRFIDGPMASSVQSVRLGPSRDPLVHIFPSSSLTKLVRICVAVLVTSMLLTPVILCHSLSSAPARLVVVLLAATIFIGTVSSFTHARMLELLVVGAT